MTRLAYGYMRVHEGKDMDGSNRTFEWIEAEPQKFEDQPANEEEKAGWFALCEVEPEMGWIGPFDSEAEAVEAATNEAALDKWMQPDDGPYRFGYN